MKAKEPINPRLSIINLYREQLKTFKKIGLGKKTEHNTVITPKLIDCTKKRLAELSANYNATLTPSAERWRIIQKQRRRDVLAD